MNIRIESAQAGDAAAISRVIIAALQASNSADYPASVIERVQRNFSPAAVEGLIASRKVFVARQGERLVGTASLDGHVVRSVFVDPELQGGGVGSALMAAVERYAGEQAVQTLLVPASLTAEGFYLRLGYTFVREVIEGEERTLVMQRQLQPPLTPPAAGDAGATDAIPAPRR